MEKGPNKADSVAAGPGGREAAGVGRECNAFWVDEGGVLICRNLVSPGPG